MATREELNKKQFDEIINEEKREKRKKIVILVFKIILIIVLIMSAFYLYTTYISTKGLITKEERITNSRIPSSFDSVKIVHFSDLHFGTTVFQSEVKKVVKAINRVRPDIVVFTGDLIDKNYKLNSKEQEILTNELKKINTTIGKYAISGEEDGEEFNTIFNQSEFIILNNDYDLVYSNDNNPILLIGLSSSLNDKRDIDNAYKYFKEETHNSKIYTICLLHETDSIDEILSKYKTDLFLAGHSHNGQIKIPFMGAISGKKGSDAYFDEFYQVNQSKIYVSSGIGTNDFGFRLFDRPSITLFRLSSK